MKPAIRLLFDALAVFRSGEERLPTRELLSRIATRHGVQGLAFEGKLLTPKKFAYLLRSVYWSIRPQVMRMAGGKLARGYTREDFEKAWRVLK
jgi:hypothetical protein